MAHAFDLPDGADIEAATEGGRVILARSMTGCRRQMKDVASFTPILILGIAVGFVGMIAAFWMANWSPSPLSGIVALLWFACSPAVAFCWWLRRKSRPSVADTELRIKDDGLEIVALHENVPSMFIAWERFTKCRKRVLAGLHFAISIGAYTEAGPLHCVVAEYALCGSLQDVLHFTEELENRVKAATT